MFCMTNTKHDPIAHDNPITLFERVKEQARITPNVNGISAVYTLDEYLTLKINL